MPRTSSRGNCDRDHSDLTRRLGKLDKSQAQPGRHVCAGCAWEAGYSQGQADADKHWRAKVDALISKLQSEVKQ